MPCAVAGRAWLFIFDEGTRRMPRKTLVRMTAAFNTWIYIESTRYRSLVDKVAMTDDRDVVMAFRRPVWTRTLFRWAVMQYENAGTAS